MFPFDILQSCFRQFRSSLEAFHRKKCLLTEKDMLDYASLTFLSEDDIRKLYYKFSDLKAVFTPDNRNPSVSLDTLENVSELIMNPFKDRITKLYSNSDDMISFENFIGMVSVFSRKAPSNIKSHYVFKILDFNDDNLLCKDDLTEMLNRLKGDNYFRPEAFQDILDTILLESDIDGDGYINVLEFEFRASKNPLFGPAFTIHV